MELKTRVVRRGQAPELDDPYEVPFEFAAPTREQPAPKPRESVLVNVISTGRRARRNATLAELREARRVEQAAREFMALEDGRHTLGGF